MIFNVRRGPRAEDVQTFYWPIYDFLEPVVILRPEERLVTILRGAAALNGHDCLRAWRSGLSARMAA